jgi:hypothetical protein
MLTKEEIKKEIKHLITEIQELRNLDSLSFPAFMALGDAVVDLSVAMNLIPGEKVC